MVSSTHTCIHKYIHRNSSYNGNCLTKIEKILSLVVLFCKDKLILTAALAK